MREPVQTTLNDEELELVDAAVERSRCNSRSAFIRAASLIVADQALRREDSHDREPEEASHAGSR